MILERLIDIIANQFSVDADSITVDTSFAGDLWADSVDIVELTMSLEDEFEFEMTERDEENMTKIQTVGDLLKFLQQRLGEN